MVLKKKEYWRISISVSGDNGDNRLHYYLLAHGGKDFKIELEEGDVNLYWWMEDHRREIVGKNEGVTFSIRAVGRRKRYVVLEVMSGRGVEWTRSSEEGGYEHHNLIGPAFVDVDTGESEWIVCGRRGIGDFSLVLEEGDWKSCLDYIGSNPESVFVIEELYRSGVLRLKREEEENLRVLVALG